ncbi:MAG: GGDEF domain-containing protein, partial [Eubacteriales bacterium]
KTLCLRGVFFLIVIALYIKMSCDEKDYFKLPYWITAGEIFISLIYYIIIKYNTEPDILFKTFDIILMIVIFNLMPNRWIYSVGVSSTAFVVLCVYSYENNQFNPGIIYTFIIAVLVSFFSYIFEMDRRENFLNKVTLVQLKNTDPLTGIYNRSKFDEELQRTFKQNEQDRHPFSLMIFDIDNFKEINDSFGHLFGDQVIVSLVEVVKHSIRATDILARWGGDEFFILLPKTKKLEAIELAKRIEVNIQKNLLNATYCVTCSFGIIEYNHEECIEELIKRADKLMYSAKHDGKNRLKYE